MKGALKVTLEGRGALTLRDSDYVTSGGEGRIYRAGDTIVKIYTDTAKMTRDGMHDKVKLLAERLKHPSIVAPQGLVLDNQSKPIGFFMPFAEGEPMPRVFVSDFRVRTGFDDKAAVSLVGRMRAIVDIAHGAKALMVDANEMNWLVDVSNWHNGPVPKVIDVDSWAIGRWPATVIMPSIRDWKAKAFDERTDWFAWGIVTFQIFTGIHPYKGKLDGYRPGEIERRMRDNASVFDSRARVPHSARDFSCIPGALRGWYEATFQNGDRSPPPSAFDAGKPAPAARVLRAVTTTTGALIHEKVFSGPAAKATRIWPCGVAMLDDRSMLDLSTGRIVDKFLTGNAEVVRVAGGFLTTEMENRTVSMNFVEDDRHTLIPFTLDASRFFRAGDRLFAVADSLLELQLRLLGRPVVTVGVRTSVRPLATSWFDGVAVQDVLGATFLVLPVDGGMVQPRVKELDGLKVITAKAAGRFAAFIGLDHNGDYRKVELTFDRTFSSYKAWEGGADGPELNMAIVSTGVVATIVNDGELTLFVPTQGAVRKIADKDITTDLRLAAWDEKLLYIKDGSIWRVRTT